MDARWKLEVWLDANLEAIQVNTVLIDAYGKLLEVNVVPVEPGQELGDLVARVIRAVSPAPRQGRIFDSDDLP